MQAGQAMRRFPGRAIALAVALLLALLLAAAIGYSLRGLGSSSSVQPSAPSVPSWADQGTAPTDADGDPVSCHGDTCIVP